MVSATGTVLCASSVKGSKQNNSVVSLLTISFLNEKMRFAVRLLKNYCSKKYSYAVS
jgi:hypothetical protein